MFASCTRCPPLLPAVQLGSSEALKIGQRVYAVGSPIGLELTLSEGVVSGFRGVKNGRYIQTTAAISPGSSGGGLFDDEGRLIGLVTFYFKDGQQLNFAAPVDWIPGASQKQPDLRATPAKFVTPRATSDSVGSSKERVDGSCP